MKKLINLKKFILVLMVILLIPIILYQPHKYSTPIALFIVYALINFFHYNKSNDIKFLKYSFICYILGYIIYLLNIFI